ncbi:MAG: hypothetical protein GY778_25960 [bacterium]|nr:hypothetical protein [bacterium]
MTEITTSRAPTAQDVSEIAAAAGGHDMIIVGTITATVEQADLVKALAATGRPMVTVALRTPFDLVAYPTVDTHVCTYSIVRPSMDALAAALFGQQTFSGRLPAALAGLYARGHGIDR